MNEILNYKGNEIESFKKQNEELDIPLNYETHFENDSSSVKKYVGNKINNKYEGRGILYGKDDKIIFNGYFKNGKYEGFGRLYDNNSNELIYIGYFKDNMYEGKGILYSNKQIKYEGNFYYGKYNGIGTEYIKNGKRKMKFFYGKPEKECYGILYDNNNNEIYKGLLKEQKPENAKSVSIYDEDGNIKYFGDFFDFKFHGKGQLYYKNNYNEKDEKIYFDGIFEKDKFIKGTLFSPEGDKVYEGEFIDNIPKEGKNISVYNIDRIIEYIGDLSNGKYNGYGKLVENYSYGVYRGFGKGKEYQDEFSEFLYEGNFIEGRIEGKGKIYYEDGITIFYDGTFKDNDLFGKGILYYINNSKKIEGIFDTLNKCKGIYYNPQGEKIYDGLIINGIPINSDNIIIYNNKCYKIYEGEIWDGVYNGKGIEFSNYIENLRLHEGFFLNNYYIDPDFNFNNKTLKIIFLSKGCPGKTCLINRLVEKSYSSQFVPTVGVDFKIMKFEFNHKKYKIAIYDTNGSDRFRNIVFSYLKGVKIAIYLIDLTNMEEAIDKQFIKEIKSKISKETLIYLVGNKIDLVEGKNNEYRDNLISCREQAKLLIENKEINYYFEVSAKNNKGIDILMKYIKWYILRDEKCHINNLYYDSKLGKYMNM